MEASSTPKPLYGLKWRSSYWYATFVVGLGICTDWVVYYILVPVLPFQLEKLGYAAPSVLTSWLLFAYCAGLVFSTIPVAMVSERYELRQLPLVCGVLVLIGSQIMLMEAPVYWLMCLARVLQGTGSAMVWVVGPALLCDMTPTQFIGRQLGVAMIGQSIGLLVGPAAGGILYARFGFRGPCIFGIITAFCDLLSRFFLIDRKSALKYGRDPAAPPGNHEISEANTTGSPMPMRELQGQTTTPLVEPTNSDSSDTTQVDVDNGFGNKGKTQKEKEERAPSPSLIFVIVQFTKSSRGIVGTILPCVYGALIMSIEPTLPLHLQASFGFDSTKVGLVFLAAMGPTFISGPLAGHISDRYGPSWISLISYVASVPWWVLMIINNLPLLIVSFALTRFWASGIVSPLMAELASVSRGIEGVGLGPIVGGQVGASLSYLLYLISSQQIYYHVHHGWMVQCLVAIGMLAFGFCLSFFYIGEDPVLRKLLRFVTARGRGTKKRLGQGSGEHNE
ncbi:major facilitator superfamily domain-containing protein [Rhodocollybia butyracea]|uniref:Major facilitator superfamily domain-containing protein n=1 Tax=Rhodocollybia butyracea TaxID=206335 RepID=A0A9P5PBW2_9AGAR|nr:major facilitator superfamily domain-containing protein [Rhodocollybia butyracea]